VIVDMKKVWTSDKIIVTTVLVSVVAAVAAAAAVIFTWLYCTNRMRKGASDPTKNKESAALMTPQSNETLHEMLLELDGTGSGSGQPSKLVTVLIIVC